MEYISFFLIISPFCSLAVPTIAQDATKINQPLKITEDQALSTGSAGTTKPNIKIKPGIIIYGDSCALNFKCVAPKIATAPNTRLIPE
jgi:hypothetical protein